MEDLVKIEHTEYSVKSEILDEEDPPGVNSIKAVKKRKRKQKSDDVVTSNTQEINLEACPVKKRRKKKNTTPDIPEADEENGKKGKKKKKRTVDAENDTVDSTEIIVKKKDKIKQEIDICATQIIPKIEYEEGNVAFNTVPLEDYNNDGAEGNGEGNNENNDDNNDEEVTIIFPKEDLIKLVERIEACIPENDMSSFRTRTKKLDWSEVAFEDYTAEKCQSTWNLILQKQRYYRTLREVLHDAMDWIKKPYQDSKKAKITHPEFPKRPLSAYMTYFIEEKDNLIKSNPSIKMPDLTRIIAQQYHSLPTPERNRYCTLAAKQKAEFDVEVEDFYFKHPEVPRPSSAQASFDKKEALKGTRKPLTPFALFYQAESDKEPNVTDKKAFKELCKETWSSFEEKNKIIWIEWALELEEKHVQDMKEYKRTHPDFVIPKNTKNLLTKEEKLIKSRIDGKPSKPPNSAYSLFSSRLLKSHELKDVESKERMRTISNRWKDLPQEEKDFYRDQSHVLMDEYKVKYAAYLDSLPQEKRQMELQNNLPRRRISKIDETANARKVEKKIEESIGDVIDVERETEKLAKPESLATLAVPDTWEDMQEGERAMYIKYIQKIKDYFDKQHQTASKNKEQLPCQY